MRKTAVFLLCLMVVPGFAHAAVDCSSTTVPPAAPLRPSAIAPVSSELAASAHQLGTHVRVLSQAYDEAPSAHTVPLRLRVRKTVVTGESVSTRVERGGCRSL